MCRKSSIIPPWGMIKTGFQRVEGISEGGGLVEASGNSRAFTVFLLLHAGVGGTRQRLTVVVGAVVVVGAIVVVGATVVVSAFVVSASVVSASVVSASVVSASVVSTLGSFVVLLGGFVLIGGGSSVS